MRELRSSRRLIKMWHRREKATIDHLVRTLDDATGDARTPHSALTASGLAVEEQIRKTWTSGSAGLAIF